MTFVFRRRFPPLKGGLAHVGLLWLRSLVTTFTNPIAPWKRERLPFVPDLVCWPPRDRQLHFPFSTSPTPPYNTTDTLSCQIVDLNNSVFIYNVFCFFWMIKRFVDWALQCMCLSSLTRMNTLYRL